MHEVTIAGRTVPYRLVRNARSRHVRMTFTPDGLRVSAPTRLSDREIRRAVQSKERWLLRHEALLHPQTQLGIHQHFHSPTVPPAEWRNQ